MARLAKIITGFTLIIAGLFMIVLPGPGILTILGGLTLIAQEYVWARRLSDWVKDRFGRYAGYRPTTPGDAVPDVIPGLGERAAEDQLGG
ncbi:MAG TPA: PGPGW domain-containing protein [Acidimicrobiia bacterium]|nr:PGPGW domain-containing protein [Acidimicrobiia bacterium]